MDPQDYDNLFSYLSEKIYPEHFTKSSKFVLRRKSRQFRIKGTQLVYIDPQKSGDDLERIVLKGTAEVEKVFLECHVALGAHRGRDATVNKVKERYYWPSYYKDLDERVCCIYVKTTIYYSNLNLK